MKKIFLIALILIVCIFTIFIVEESIRLEKTDNAVPLIVFHIDENYSTDSKQKESVYYSVGFKIKMKFYLEDMSSSDNYMYNLIGEEFYLFNKILLWAWIS